MLPTAAAERDINWARDRQALWNAAEVSEKRKDARVAREYELALPHEMTANQRVELVRGFAGDIANRYGVAVDFAIHRPHRSGDERNFHAHVLATTRQVEPAGLGAKASMEWSDTDRAKKGLGPAKGEIKEIRARWEELTNARLQQLGIEARINHRSLEAQGIEREPQSHLGPAVSGMERRGIETEVGKRLDHEALVGAQQRLEKAAELSKLERESRELTASIIDVSCNLEGARLARAREQTPTLEQLQQEGRKRWLAMRIEQKAKEQAPERAPEKEIEKTPVAGRSLDEERQQAIERWRESRSTQDLNQGREPSQESERKGSGKNLGLEREGAELE